MCVEPLKMFDRFWICLCLWRLVGVSADSDAVKSVSVVEGYSVTLQTNTEIKTNDLITWTFGLSKTCIAQINKDVGRFSTYDVHDGRFRDRLKLDHQTGSLTIINTKTTHSGLYQVTIRSRKATYRFNVTVSGVFADSNAVKSVSVMEGDSVTLESGFTELQTKDGIMWTFGLSETCIAQVYKEAGIFSTFDGPDGKFRDRLKLDHQTGSLTITNTRITDSGLYQVTISSRTDIIYRFRVSVSDVFVDSDAVTSVSVMEGDSVTLESGLTEIQTKGGIMWTFGLSKTRIAQIHKQAGRFSTYDGPDRRFRDRLKLDHQTGSLTITNTRTTHSGLYQVTISGTTDTTHRFNVTASGVFADSDAVKSVSVMEGDSVTLQTNTELQTENMITWTFGLSETRIAQINKDTGRFSTYDVLDGRFRDRLKVDHQTGSLTITNTRTTHSGLYQVIISGTTDTTYRFNVTVSDSVCGCDSAEAVIRLVVSALVGVAATAAVVVLVYDIRSRRAENDS